MDLARPTHVEWWGDKIVLAEGGDDKRKRAIDKWSLFLALDSSNLVVATASFLLRVFIWVLDATFYVYCTRAPHAGSAPQRPGSGFARVHPGPKKHNRTYKLQPKLQPQHARRAGSRKQVKRAIVNTGRSSRRRGSRMGHSPRSVCSFLAAQLTSIDEYPSWLALFATFGYASSFGVYQDLYTRAGTSSSSNVSWIGSSQLFFFIAMGLPAGKLLDKGYFKSVVLVGSIIYIFSYVFPASQNKT